MERELVAHPGSVGILALTDEQHVVMIRNRRYSLGEELWEVPAGTLEPSEPPAACAARELEEEAGFRAATLEPLARFHLCPGYSNECMHAYLARGLTQVGQRLEPEERIRVEVLPLYRVREMMLDGVITDAKTLAAVGMYLLRKGV